MGKLSGLITTPPYSSFHASSNSGVTTIGEDILGDKTWIAVFLKPAPRIGKQENLSLAVPEVSVRIGFCRKPETTEYKVYWQPLIYEVQTRNMLLGLEVRANHVTNPIGQCNFWSRKSKPLLLPWFSGL